MPCPVAEVANAFVAGARREGLEPDADLRILQYADDTVGCPPAACPEDLGPLHEASLTDSARTRRGAWYTPGQLAHRLVEHALPDRAAVRRGTVLDPACGGGAFLLAAARRSRDLGLAPGESVGNLRGRDVDPVAVAVSEAALWWWSARCGAPVVLGPALSVGDGLTGGPWGAHGAVIGNPPFLGQLRSSTAVDRTRREALRTRFGDAVRAYTDPAWLFLVAAVEAVAPGGRVVMIQPQSVLAARDAGAVRGFVDQRAELLDNVVDDEAAFTASVSVCAPVLERSAEVRAETNDWVALLADARGVPPVDLGAGPVLGDIADVHAGFRDEYYGLVDAVHEGGAGPKLVTAGAIDPLRLLERSQRFAGRRWSDPRVDASRARGRARRWLAVQDGPKVLVATQTRVLEAVADPRGDLVGSVPVLCVRPHDPELLWHVLAALHAPAVSAWLLRQSVGTALSADACKPTAALLSALPLPRRPGRWDRAAALARDHVVEGAGLGTFVTVADAAYGIDDEGVRRWWSNRRPVR